MVEVPRSDREAFELFRFSRRERVFVVCAALAAFIIRLAATSVHTVINGDGIYYASLGSRLAEGDLHGGISSYWAPLYPILIGLFTFFFDDLQTATQAVSVLAGALLVVPAYLLIREVFGSASAVIGTLLIVVHPALIRASTWEMTESLYTLIFTTILLVGWHAIASARKYLFFLTGLLLGAAYLTKPEAIAFVGLYVVLAVAAKFTITESTHREVSARILLLLAGFAILFLPYFVAIHQKTGRWTISQKVQSNTSVMDQSVGLLKLIDGGSTTMRDRLFDDDYEIGEQKAGAAQTTATKVSVPASGVLGKAMKVATGVLENLRKELRDYRPYVSPVAFVIFVIFALIPLGSKPSEVWKNVYLSLFVCSAVVGYPATVVELRYMFPLIPVMVCWVAGGVEKTVHAISIFVGSSGRTSGRLVWMLRGAAVLVLLGSLIPVANFYLQPEELKEVPFEEKAAGYWLREQAGGAGTVMSSNPTVAFYAGAKHIYVPDEDFQTVIDYARRRGADYLVYSERRVNNTPNAFPPLGTDEQGLRLVYNNGDYPGHAVIIWRLNR